MTKLTEKKYWNNFWNKIKLPKPINMRLSYERTLANYFKENLDKFKPGSLIEIGCAPGSWLAFFDKLGFLTSGIEYCIDAGLATGTNLKLLNSNASVIIADFFSPPIFPKFDNVCSLGFVEHFSNAEDVLLKHCEYIKPSGHIIVGVPNFGGIYYSLQKYLDQNTLKAHNIQCMNKKFFESFASKNGFKILHFAYIGSFEPALFIGNSKKNLLNYMIMKTLSLLSKIRNYCTFLDNFNNPLWSFCMICILKKNNKDKENYELL